MLALEGGLRFDASREGELFAAIPAHSGVLRIDLRSGAGATMPAESYLARSSDLRRLAERLLRDPAAQRAEFSGEASGNTRLAPRARLNLRAVAESIHYRATGSKFEQNLVMYQQTRRYFPRRYRDFLRMKPPALLKVNLRNEYPRCYVTRRVLEDDAFYCGPFSSRKAAVAFAEEFLNLFKIRRCQIKIRRDPCFPGCIYSEMKMCLAPCFAGCSKEEYDAQVQLVVGTLASGGSAFTSDLERQRTAASEALDFERAAALQKKLEKASAVLRGMPELARRVEELNAVVVQKAREQNTAALFVIEGGIIGDPFFLRFGELSSQPRSAESILREHLAASAHHENAEAGQLAAAASRTSRDSAGQKLSADQTSFDAPVSDPFAAQAAESQGQDPAPDSRRKLSDHLSLLARWYYSKPRQGEIFFRQPEWPYRRVVRACSRLLQPQPSLPFPANPAANSPANTPAAPAKPSKE